MKLVRIPGGRGCSMPISQAFAITITIAVDGPSSGNADDVERGELRVQPHVLGGFPVEHALQVVRQQPFEPEPAATAACSIRSRVAGR